MRLRSRQRGMGWFGMLIVGGLIAFFAIVVIKVGPMYLNDMKVRGIVDKVADNSDQARMELPRMQGYIAQYWNIEKPQYLEIKDLKVKRTDRGRYLRYEYEAREKLFYNVFIVLAFEYERSLPQSVES